MRTTVAIPDVLLESIDGVARRTGLSRNAIVKESLWLYLDRYHPDDFSAAPSRLADETEESSEDREFRQAANRAVFKAIEG